MNKRAIELKLKRGLDILGALTVLIVFSPIMLVVAALVWFNFGRPILYTSPRIGQKAKTFQAYKFRSMLDLRDAQGKPLPDAERLTPFSNFIRATSLDELPQVFNVLKGEMSLIGPRAIITDFLAYLDEKELRRLDMPPGITGLAQVNGRNALHWDKRLEMDVWYVDNWSLWLDIKIAFKTIPVWLGAQGINTPGHATFERLDEVRHTKPKLAEQAEQTKLTDNSQNA